MSPHFWLASTINSMGPKFRHRRHALPSSQIYYHAVLHIVILQTMHIYLFCITLENRENHEVIDEKRKPYYTFDSFEQPPFVCTTYPLIVSYQ